MPKATPKTSQLRIIAGTWRGRLLEFLPNNIRPTPNRVRETLFNWLQLYIENADCLDLFAGSGALSFEALSRGAAKVVAIDQSSTATQYLHHNAHKLATNNIEIIHASAEQFFTKYANIDKAFDIVFLDPPFYQNLLLPSLQQLLDRQCLKETSLIYFESEKELILLDGLINKFEILKQKRAGDVVYGLLKIK